MSDKITLITPTSDRPQAFALCERWMKRQTFKGAVQWIVVDDGEEPVPTTCEQSYIRRARDTLNHSLVPNLLAALPHITSHKVLIIEDDDYYAPHYLQSMSDWLDQYPLVGEMYAKYYHLFYGWLRAKNTEHGSLCRTGFTSEVFSTLEKVLEDPTPWVDMRLWAQWQGEKYLHDDSQDKTNLTIGIKGMPGRPGATWGWKRAYRGDPGNAMLLRWSGGDSEVVSAYKDLRSTVCTNGDQVIVYTAVFGPYDRLKQPAAPNPGVRYVCFTDQKIAAPGWWDVVQVEPTESSPTRENRKWKILAHHWFPEAEWWIYLDGNMRLKVDPYTMLVALRKEREAPLYVTQHGLHNCLYKEADWIARNGYERSDILHKQVCRYRSSGYPKENGCCYCGFLIRKNTEEVRAFNELWWQEVKTGSQRDQLSFPYAAWLSKIPYCAVPESVRDHYISCELRHSQPRGIFA